MGKVGSAVFGPGKFFLTSLIFAVKESSLPEGAKESILRPYQQILNHGKLTVRKGSLQLTL
jgi:hypothetical protein